MNAGQVAAGGQLEGTRAALVRFPSRVQHRRTTPIIVLLFRFRV
jgi:hypothetical protein